MTQYLISHTYLTRDDAGQPVVETESCIASDVSDVQWAIAAMLDAPGGRAGTTVALTVTPTGDSAITL